MNSINIPITLARTSAFVPRWVPRGRPYDFEKLYVVTPYTAIRIRGRELGIQHRLLLYTIFRFRFHQIPGDKDTPLLLSTTWRTFLKARGLSSHKTNIKSLQLSLLDLATTSIEVCFRNSHEANVPFSKQFHPNIIQRIHWGGCDLDDALLIKLSRWVRTPSPRNHLIRLDPAILSLRSGLATTLAPFIASQPAHNFIEEWIIAELADESPAQLIKNSKARAQFRVATRVALSLLRRNGTLKSWKKTSKMAGQGHLLRYDIEQNLPD